jgi:hypothetical protein
MAINDKLKQVGAPEQQQDLETIRPKLRIATRTEEVGYQISWRWVGELMGVQLSGFGDTKNDGYLRAGRGVVSTGGRSMPCGVGSITLLCTVHSLHQTGRPHTHTADSTPSITTSMNKHCIEDMPLT